MKTKIKTNCPICGRAFDYAYGINSCTHCNSEFELENDGKINLIKNKHFDYFTFLLSLIFPILIIVLVLIDSSRYLFKEEPIILAILAIFLPIFFSFRQLLQSPRSENVTYIDLYRKFFKRVLHKEDYGRKIGFYIIFFINIFGLILIITTLINKL